MQLFKIVDKTNLIFTTLLGCCRIGPLWLFGGYKFPNRSSVEWAEFIPLVWILCVIFAQKSRIPAHRILKNLKQNTLSCGLILMTETNFALVFLVWANNQLFFLFYSQHIRICREWDWGGSRSDQIEMSHVSDTRPRITHAIGHVVRLSA